MKAFMLGLLIKAVKALVTGALFDHIKALVISQVNSELTGEQKKAVVVAQVTLVKGDLAIAAKAAGANLINLAIEAALASINK